MSEINKDDVNEQPEGVNDGIFRPQTRIVGDKQLRAYEMYDRWKLSPTRNLDEEFLSNFFIRVPNELPDRNMLVFMADSLARMGTSVEQSVLREYMLEIDSDEAIQTILQPYQFGIRIYEWSMAFVLEKSGDESDVEMLNRAFNYLFTRKRVPELIRHVFTVQGFSTWMLVRGKELRQAGLVYIPVEGEAEISIH